MLSLAKPDQARRPGRARRGGEVLPGDPAAADRGRPRRRRRSGTIRKVLAGFVIAVGASIALFLPPGGLQEMWDHTIGFQLTRPDVFSIWALHPALAPIKVAVEAFAVILAVLVAFRPRGARTPAQVAALGAAADHRRAAAGRPLVLPVHRVVPAARADRRARHRRAGCARAEALERPPSSSWMSRRARAGARGRREGRRDAARLRSRVRGRVRRHDRVVPERRRLPPAAPRVARPAGLALPGLRDRDQGLRQRAGARLADAARSLPQLPDARSRRAIRSSRRSPRALAVAVVLTKHSAAEIVLGLVLDRGARAGRADRPRAPDHPEQDHPAGGRRRGGDRRGARPARRARAADRRRRRRRLPARCSRSRTRAGWAWATSSWPPCSGCSWAARSPWRSSPASCSATRRRRGRDGARRRREGPQDRGAVRAVPGARRRHRRCSPARRSSTGTCTPGSDARRSADTGAFRAGRCRCWPASLVALLAGVALTVTHHPAASGGRRRAWPSAAAMRNRTVTSDRWPVRTGTSVTVTAIDAHLVHVSFLANGQLVAEVARQPQRSRARRSSTTAAMRGALRRLDRV